jgi:hypothetical protein
MFGGEVEWISRCLAGTILITSGLLKVTQRRKFHDSLSATEIMPAGLAGVFSWVIPPGEMILGGALLAAFRLDWTLPSALLLIAAFLIFLAVFRLRGGKEFACGCFGDFEQKNPTWRLILRGALLLAATAAPVFSGRPAELRLTDILPLATATVGLMLAWILLARLFDAVAWLRESES